MNDTLIEACKIFTSVGIDSIYGVISTGSGQSINFAGFEKKTELRYSEIPGMDESGLKGHGGVLKVFSVDGKKWALWTGRRHFYQGYSFDEVGYYIKLSSEMGAKNLLCVNSSGGLNSEFSVGDIVSVKGYKIFAPVDGIEHESEGGEFRETSARIRNSIAEASMRTGIPIREGNYAGVSGPVYETMAEVHWLRKLGCDLVGMSTVPELVMGERCGMEVSALSLVTNVHGKTGKVSHDEVVSSAESSGRNLDAILREYVKVI